MAHKILVADDSQTIQKVIKITLANEDYEIIECLSYEEVALAVSTHKPKLVLLDYSLSETKSGFDIAKELKSLGVSKIFMLYGTFDSIDETGLKSVGVDAHIVKPFEGTKFIKTCRSLMSSSDSVTPITKSESFVEDFPEVIEEAEEVEGEEWVVNQPEVIEKEEDFDFDIKVAQTKNELQSQVADWGFDIEIPSVIGEESKIDTKAMDFPPVIEEDFADELGPEHYQGEEVLPDNDDLEYPDIDMIKSTVEAELELEPKSQLISVAELAVENTEEQDSTEVGDGTKTEEEIRNIEALIADEMEEDIWSADEVIEDESAQMLVEEPKIEVIEHDEDSNINDTIGESTDTNIDISVLATSDLEQKIAPIIEKIVEEKIANVIENIAWEVIPDLAENLIKKELEKIASEILSKPDN